MLLITLEVIAIVLILLVLYARLSLGKCKSHVCLIGKTALVTGGNSGIGYETALALAERGCRVIIADKDNCDGSKAKLIKETGNSNIAVKNFNLASLKSVRALAKDINETEERLDILINNAAGTGLGNGCTEDGLNIGMQVNHFGSFLLTHLLIDLLKKSAPSRIIFVSSYLAAFSNLTKQNLNFPKEQPFTASYELMLYCNSKLCNIITSRELAKKLEGTGVTSNSLHPGVVSTLIYKRSIDGLKYNKLVKIILYGLLYYGIFNFKPILKTTEEAAQTTIYLAMAKEVENVTGKYFLDCWPYRTPSRAKDDVFANEIWKASEDYVRLAPDERL